MEVAAVLKLIKLEMKKVKMGAYIRSALIANLAIVAIILLMIFASKNEGEVHFSKFDFIFFMVESMIKATFQIFSAVLLTKFVIEEFKSNTITVLFMYPTNRKKLMSAKLIIVALFTFIATVLSGIFINFVLLMINNFYSFSADKLTTTILVNNLITIIVTGVTSAGIGLIPLYFGMRKKSVPATIVSAIIMVSILNSGGTGFSLGAIIAIPISLAVIGITVAYLSIRNIEHRDITN
jgi:ABC-type transport system involved in multi-copper enzyme maturation permease subunit